MSQRTAFFHLGNLVEEGATQDIFTNLQDSSRRTTSTGRLASPLVLQREKDEHVRAYRQLL